jgi:chromosome segregation ATPase
VTDFLSCPQPYSDIDVDVVDGEMKYAGELLDRVTDLFRAPTQAERVDRSWDADLTSERELLEEYYGVLDELTSLKRQRERVVAELGWLEHEEEHLMVRFDYADEIEDLDDKIAEGEDYVREWDWTAREVEIEKAERRYRADRERRHVARMRANVRPVCARLNVNRNSRSHRPVRVAAKKTAASTADGESSSEPPSRGALHLGGAL